MTINHLGISGGKDSTALLLWAVHGSGYPKESIRATFADTGNEAPETIAFVEHLSKKVHPIETIYPALDFYELAIKKHRFPSATVRFCTTELKMKPSRDYVYKLIEEGYDVLLHTGVRASESLQRSTLEERAFDDWYGLNVYRPLLRWSLDDVWAIHEKYGITPNPLYARGCRRVGCLPCIMSSKEEIKIISEAFPLKIAAIREAEKGEVSRECNTFFSPDKVPLRFRSRTIKARKSGQLIRIAMIDDVVRWSKTGYRGEESGVLDFEDEPSSCSHISGACE